MDLEKLLEMAVEMGTGAIEITFDDDTTLTIPTELLKEMVNEDK